MDGLIEISTPEGKQFDEDLHLLAFNFYLGDGDRADSLAEAIEAIEDHTPLKDCPRDCPCGCGPKSGDPYLPMTLTLPKSIMQHLRF